MKRLYAFILLSLLSASVFPHSAFAQVSNLPQLSPLTKMYLQSAAGGENAVVPGYVYKNCNGRIYISALLQVTPGFSDENLKAAGILIGTKAGNIWTAQIPVASVVAATRIPGVAYIQLDEPVHTTLDSARRATGVDSVQAGLGLSAPFFGKGVVMGIVDAGFDFGSPALWDTSGKRYRVKRIWMQKAAIGTPPAGFSYGAEMNDSASMVGAGTDQASMSHGAHVTGIATGSGFGSLLGNDNRLYRGIAPMSDVVLVGIMPAQQQWIGGGGTDVIDGINYVFQYAAKVGKPAVINLSWGTSLGAHDGNSLFCQAIDNLCGPGKIFVNSAGNSGGTKMHLQKTFSTTDTLLNTFPTYDTGKKRTWVDIWGDSSKTFCMKVTLYNGAAAGAGTGFVCMDGAVHNFPLIGSNGDTCFIALTPVASEYNHKPHAFLSLYSKTKDSICVTLKGSAGTVNLWDLYVEAPNGYESPFTNGGKSWAVGGDTLQTISDNTSARSAITVGAYSTKLAWKAIGGHYNYTAPTALGAIAPFSSIGPSSDGRMKPDISGPGFGVVSTVNSYDPAFKSNGSSYGSSVVFNDHFDVTGRDQPYAIFAGTSMSSPVVAGIVALMLEANKNLDPARVKSILNATAKHDAFTGSAMNNTWGGGKVNAYAALKAALQTASVGGNLSAGTLACNVFPNPSSGSATIGLLSERDEQLRITVYDIAGRAVLQDAWSVKAGYNTRALVLNGMVTGVYLVKLGSARGEGATIRWVVE